MLADQSSSDVAEAVKDGILVEEMNLIKCTICKTPLNGIRSAESHLQGAKHKRAVENFYLQAASKQSSCDTVDSSSIDVVAAIRNGIVSSGNVGNQIQLTCVPCNKTCMGPVPMKQHLSSDAHTKKMKVKGQIARFSPNKEVPATVIKPNTNNTLQFDSAAPANTSTVQENQVSMAMVAGIIIPAEYKEDHFTCLVCNIDCTGEDAMKDHLNGKRHKKNQKKKLLQQSGTATEMMVETSPIPLASSTAPIKSEIMHFIPPPPQFLDSKEVRSTAFRDLKHEEPGDNMEGVPMSSTRTFNENPIEDIIDNIRIYGPEDDLSDVFDDF